MNISNCKAYELVNTQEMPDLNSTGFLLRHKKTGAHLVLVENEDNNKVFSIGFRTPPKIPRELPILSNTRFCAVRKNFP